MSFQNLSISKTKFIRSLHLNKNRQKYNKYIAEGHKICKDILGSNAADVQYVVGTEKWIESNIKQLLDTKIECFVSTEDELRKITQLSTASQVLLVADKPKSRQDDILLDFSLYLDAIRNPGNMGAILRVADWYGISCIFLSVDCVDIYNPKVIQASMSSFLRVETKVSELSALKEEGFKLYGASLDGEEEYELTPNRKLLVIGNEGQGIRLENQSLIDKHIKISSAKSLGAESLNAAVATGILCDRFLK